MASTATSDSTQIRTSSQWSVSGGLAPRQPGSAAHRTVESSQIAASSAPTSGDASILTVGASTAASRGPTSCDRKQPTIVRKRSRRLGARTTASLPDASWWRRPWTTSRHAARRGEPRSRRPKSKSKSRWVPTRSKTHARFARTRYPDRAARRDDFEEKARAVRSFDAAREEHVQSELGDVLELTLDGRALHRVGGVSHRMSTPYVNVGVSERSPPRTAPVLRARRGSSRPPRRAAPGRARPSRPGAGEPRKRRGRRRVDARGRASRRC